MFQITILTLFPEVFPGPVGCSVLGRAHKNGLWAMNAVQIRDYATDKHQSVDDIPYGGGAGMVMNAPVLDSAIMANHNPNHQLIYMSPAGRPLTTPLAKQLAGGAGMTIICGRYEGIDERVLIKHQPLEISLGDFVLTGGEIPAMALCDAVLRQINGVLGASESLEYESHNGLGLEYPQYTRPEIWENYKVPNILLTGHHKNIKEWRRLEALARTRTRRPDLLLTKMDDKP